MRRLLLTACLLFGLPVTASAQLALSVEEGSPYYLHGFAPEDYGAHSQNWEIVQDGRGLIFIANTHGVMEFDGRRWRHLPLPEGGDQAARSLALAPGGTIFVGGVGEVGYLAPDSLGLLRYVSLLPHIAPDDRAFADVWTTHALGDAVYFQSSDRLFRWAGGRMRAWRSETRFHKSFDVGGRLYVREEGVGLRRLEGDRLVLVPGGAEFAWMSVYAVLPHPDGLLVGTRAEGFFLLSGGGVRPHRTEADPYLGTYRPYNALVVEGGAGRAGRLYLITTFGGGVLLLDQDGALVRIYSEDAGIASDDFVFNAALDRQGGLWLALNNGICRVDVLTPLTEFGLVHGLQGAVYDILRHDGTLYVATSAGLFRLVPGQTGVESTGRPRYARFEQVEGVPGQVWALLSDPAGVLAATNDGVYVLRERGPQILRADKAFALYPSPSNPGRVYVGLKDGLALMERVGGTWREVYAVGGLGEIRSMEEDARGQLWVAPLQGGLKRLRWGSAGVGQPEITSFGEEHGLPGGILNVWPLGGELAAIGKEGAYRFRDGGTPFTVDEALREALGRREIAAISEGPSGRLWIYDGGAMRVLDPARGGYRDTTPAALRLLETRVLAIYEEDDGTVWLGTEAGLIRHDPRIEKEYGTPYAAQIRAVLGRPADLLFGGAFGEGRVVGSQTESNFLVLPYERNGLRFEYAAPSYNFPEGTEFQYLLEGFDAEWSAWSKEDHTEFTNLPERRHYTFRVRARNAQGVVGEESAFAFRVLPPWHRTWWAYSLYVLAFSVTLWGFSTWRIREHQRDLEEERMLNQRLDRMNARLAETNERLRKADKLKDDLLANTSHELRTPLTAILGFSAVLEEEGDEEQRELAHAIHRSGQRLLDTVNGLLDMAKLKANLLELRPSRLDVAEVATDVLTMLRPIAEERGLSLRLVPEGLAVPAVTDQYALERILINLVSNALKFTEEGGVTVLLDADDAEVRITVRDTGIGMDGAFLPHLFDAFKQESTGYSRSHEGSGLGLTIVKRVVELLGGRIGVESRPGAGSTFEVALPRYPVGGDGAARQGGVSAPSLVSEPVLSGARVLALTADAETRMRLEAFLGSLCTLVPVETAAGALQEAKAAPFDVVLVEQRGGVGACAALAAIRALPGYARIPAAVLTAGPEGDVCGVSPDHVLALPLEQGPLLELLEALLTRADGALVA